MTTTLQAIQHVYLDEDGVPRVGDTRMKVIDLVVAHQSHSYTAEDLHFHFPDISMSQAHAALAYYWDNKAELDAAIDAQRRYVDMMRESFGDRTIASKLRAKGLIE